MSAQAGELAVLDLDGYGLPYDDVILVTQGLRDAVLEDGAFYPIDEFEISDRLSAGQASELDEARRLVAEGRRALDLGNAGYALQQLSDALSLHEAVGSQLGRRPELADAHYYTGLSLLLIGRSWEAAEHFLKTEQLYSDYLSTRAPAPSPQVTALYERAVADLAAASHDFPPTETLQAIIDRLDVDALIVGWIDGAAVIQTRMIQRGKVVGEFRTTSINGTPYPGDPVFGEIINELFSNADMSSAVASPLPDYTSPADSSGGSSSSDSAPIFAAIPDVDGPVNVDEDPYATEVIEAPPPSEEKRERGTRLRKNQVGKIKSSGRIRYNDGPITQKWWFWTAAGAVVVGGGTTAAVLTLNNIADAPATAGVIDDSPTYTVSLETGG